MPYDYNNIQFRAWNALNQTGVRKEWNDVDKKCLFEYNFQLSQQ